MPRFYVPTYTKSQKVASGGALGDLDFHGQLAALQLPFNCFGVSLVVELALKRISENFKHICSATTRMCKNVNPRGCYAFMQSRRAIKEFSQQ